MPNFTIIFSYDGCSYLCMINQEKKSILRLWKKRVQGSLAKIKHYFRRKNKARQLRYQYITRYQICIYMFINNIDKSVLDLVMLLYSCTCLYVVKCKVSRPYLIEIPIFPLVEILTCCLVYANALIGIQPINSVVWITSAMSVPGFDIKCKQIFIFISRNSKHSYKFIAKGLQSPQLYGGDTSGRMIRLRRVRFYFKIMFGSLVIVMVRDSILDPAPSLLYSATLSVRPYCVKCGYNVGLHPGTAKTRHRYNTSHMHTMHTLYCWSVVRFRFNLPKCFKVIILAMGQSWSYPIGDWLNVHMCPTKSLSHDDVIKWKHFPRYWPFVWRIHRVPVEFTAQRPVTRSFDVFFDLRLDKPVDATEPIMTSL